MQEQNQHSRRKFITSLGLLSAVTSLNSLTLFAKEREHQQEGGVMKCKPYLQAAQGNAMNIRWITNVKCFSWVEYGETAEKLDRKAVKITDGLIQANNTINDITLEHLQPGKTYYYKAVSKKIERYNAGKLTYGETAQSDVYSFAMPSHNTQKVQFSVFNDVHDRPETFGLFLKDKQADELDFVMLNGDIFSSMRGGEDQIVNHLLNPVADLFATRIPFIYSRGNHEARGEFARQLPDYINGREHKFYYSFQQGPVYAIVLDSGEDKDDTHPDYGGILAFDAYRLQQKAWLEQEVQKEAFKKARYRVVFHHIPPFYTANKDAHGTVSCRELWVPVLNKAKVDLMICGHTHIHRMHQAVLGRHNFPIVIGGGPLDGKRTIINVKADQQALDLQMIDDGGSLVGRLTL